VNRLVVIAASLFIAAVLTVSGNGPLPAAAAKGTWPADISLSPSVAPAGEQVVVQGHGPSTPDDAECVVTLAGSPVTAACTINGSGTIAASFHVPPDLPAQAVPVAVCWPGCDDDTPPPIARDYWQADATPPHRAGRPGRPRRERRRRDKDPGREGLPLAVRAQPARRWRPGQR